MRIRIESEGGAYDTKIIDMDSEVNFEDNVLDLSVYFEDGLLLADLTVHVDEMDIVADLRSINKEQR